MEQKIDTIKILSKDFFFIKSRSEVYPLTFTGSIAFTDLQIDPKLEKV